MKNRMMHCHLARHTLYILLLVSIFCLSSCKDDHFIEKSNGKHATPVTVSMSIKVATYETPSDSSSTRALNEGFIVTFNQPSNKAASRASSGETALHNLWVIQFDTKGAVSKVSKIDEIPNPVKDMVTIDTELYVGTDQTIYLVSLGKSYADVDLSGIKSISELEKLTLDYITFVNGSPTPRVTKEEDVPYWGFHTGIDIIELGEGGKGYVKYDPAGNFNGGISMRAMLAKVTIDLSYNVSGFNPLYLVANKVPTKFALNSDNYTPTDFVDFEAILLKENEVSNGNRFTYTWYLPPNPQGKVKEISTQSLRYFYYNQKNEPQGMAPHNGTYINLCAYNTKSQNSYAFYYIFLGCNTTDDFNVYPASYYNMRTDINIPPDNTDGRVVSNTITQKIDMVISGWISSSLGNKNVFTGTSSNYDFDAHTGVHPIEVTLLRGSVEVSVFEAAAEYPITIDRSWIKLSTYANYTDAYNESLKGNPNGLSTSIKLSTNIPQIFKLYMYNDEYEKYNMMYYGDDKILTDKRSLFIGFTFKAENTAAEKHVARIDQRPAFYVGRFGGETRNNDGSYPQGLVYESVVETDPPGSRLLSYYSGISISRGYYNTTWDQVKTYDVANKVSGRKATRALSENSNGFNLMTKKSQNQIVVEAPRWVNGMPDLYQYDYHISYGFAVRYCYDKNRDTNGNGRIDDKELIWYMPSYYQNLAVNFNFHSENQAIKNRFPAGQNGLYCTTMYDYEHAYNTYNDLPTLRNSQLESINKERCVRNVPPPTGSTFPTGAKVSIEDGYAVIDATGFLKGAYVDNIKTSFFTDKNGRVKRHILAKEGDTKYEESKKVSARFRVAPKDLPKMTWAEASGFDTTGNQSEPNISLNPKETGCAMYDVQNPGRWRLPTSRELVLIEMMEEAMAKTSNSTGFQKLTEGESYWSATEKTDNGRTYHALSLGTNRYIEEVNRNALKTIPYFVRCIQDLPEK